MNYVFDSSSLIYLGKLKILEKLNAFEGEKFIPESVYKEVITEGLSRNEPEVKYIENLIKKNFFTIKKSKIIIENAPYLSEADKEVLSLAKETKSIAIIDEIYARNVAVSYAVENHGTVCILLSLLN